MIDVRDGPDGSCPSLESLARWRDRSLEAALGLRLERHLASCPDCRKSFDELDRHESLLDRLAHAIEPTSAGETLVIEGYAIEREIGRGGQGIVYAATQRSTGQRVAIKILLHGPCATARELARFRREIDLAVRLDHPGFVRVYDSGLTDDGRLYLVMEYVDGRPIDAVGGPAVPIADIVATVAEAADAVEAAHQRGVVHRDLKPGNVLVDRDGRPRVLDLGLAKTLADIDGAGPRVTRTGAVFGTPVYAAPEQLLGGSDADDVRVDVFALGVILFEALTGHLPHPLEGSLAHHLDEVRHSVPPRPSLHRSDVPRDLDWIIATAITPEVQRRYTSAGALGRDLHRFLACEPVVARPSGSLYRLRKFAERNRALAGALAASFVLLLAGLVVVSALFVRTSRAEAETQTQLATARRETARAQAYGDALRHLVLAAGPDTTEGRDTTLLRELLDAHAARSWTELATQPEVLAEVQFTLGQAYSNLMLYGPARRLLANVSELQAGLHGSESRERARVLMPLATAQLYTGDPAGAESSAREAVRILVAHPDATPVERARAKGALAHVLQSGDTPARDAYDEAVELSEDAVALYASALGPDHETTLAARAMHANVLIDADRLDEAEPLMREVRDQRRNRYGRYSPHYAADTLVLGRVASRLGRLDEAADLLVEGIDLRRRLLGDRSFALGWPLRELMRVRMRQGRALEAEGLAREAIEICDAAMTPEHPERLETRGELAAVLLCLNRRDEAMAILREVIPAFAALPAQGRFVGWLRTLQSGESDPCASFDI